MSHYDQFLSQGVALSVSVGTSLASSLSSMISIDLLRDCDLYFSFLRSSILHHGSQRHLAVFHLAQINCSGPPCMTSR